MSTSQTAPWSWVNWMPELTAPVMVLFRMRMLEPCWIWIESSWEGLPPQFGSDSKWALSWSQECSMTVLGPQRWTESMTWWTSTRRAVMFQPRMPSM